MVKSLFARKYFHGKVQMVSKSYFNIKFLKFISIGRVNSKMSLIALEKTKFCKKRLS